MSTDDVTRATRAARRYRDLGLSPLPSVNFGTKKRPTLETYAQHQREPLPESYFDDWGTPNIQLMTGTQAYGPTKVIAVDCDGDPAISRFESLCKSNGFDPADTWRVHTGGLSGGMHFYFQIPGGVEYVPSGLIWGLWDTYGKDGRGAWAKHQEVRILGRGGLAVAPPSLHVETRRRYQFFGADPVVTPVPAEAPGWLLAMPRLSAPRFGPEPERTPPVKTSTRPAGRFLDRNAVLAAIPDKAALAASWGLRFAGQENASGWRSCYAAGREDRSPSASFDVATGAYQDRADGGGTISLFDLSVRLGRFSRWEECRDWCGSEYLGPGPYAQAVAFARTHA